MSEGAMLDGGSEQLASEDEDEEYYIEDEDSLQMDDAFMGEFAAEPLSQVPGSKKEPFEILSLSELRARYDGDLQRVCDMLGLTRDNAELAMRHYDWDIIRLNECWFDDCEKTKAAIGISGEGGDCIDATGEAQCPVCFTNYETASMLSAGCGHYVCKDCWAQYLTAYIDEKHKVMRLKCPQVCQAIVPRSVLAEVATTAQLAKLAAYDDALLVETNSRASWCAGAECRLVAVTNRPPPKHPEPLDVHCKCGSAYCFTCKSEAHRPVDCETVKQWMIKNSAESSNLTWIIANTKLCPKCQRPIEKNQGCMHMTCSQCRHEFCWLCLGTWSQHSDSTGGYYACNKYEEARRKGDFSAEEMRRKHARDSLERYTHYYERYHAHDNARKAALLNLAAASGEHLKQISTYTKTPESQLRFILEAHMQVVECRRILKWTYAYGYYRFDTMSMDPGEDASAAAQRLFEERVQDVERRKAFFEFLQGDAESSLEPLSSALEKQLKPFQFEEDHCTKYGAGKDGANEALDKVVLDDFALLQHELINRTQIAKTYFSKLVQELEKGLDNIEERFTGIPEADARDLLEAGSGSGAVQAP